MTKIKRALISVSDKTNLVEFCTSLRDFDVEIISTGGTHEYLKNAGIAVTPVSDVTGFPEILDGRVKTLHPNIHGGLLARRDLELHRRQLEQTHIEPIDLVAINLYPFEKTIQRDGVALDEAIEQIDIGGPSMLRSAAKNYAFVTALCEAHDYARVIEEMKANDGCVSDRLRFELAMKVFEITASYDSIIADFLSTQMKHTEVLPARMTFSTKKIHDLRYGENPHQEAALYGRFDSFFEKLHGKELSFNNIVDIQASIEMLGEFQEPASAIIKHTNPCGCAIGDRCLDAYRKALSTDAISAFGGIVAFNREVDATLAQELNKIFLEVVIAPAFSQEALELLRQKKDRRLIIQKKDLPKNGYDLKPVAGGFLVQTKDCIEENPDGWKVVTQRAPTLKEHSALLFAWKVAKHVKSNAIVYANETQTLGVGAGQMSRVDSSAIAVQKASSAGLSLTGSVVASDAFFPFADGLLAAIRAGATAVIQPGGSVRDAEVIQSANEYNIAMLFTGIRHFKH